MKITAIICAYNEESTINEVVTTVCDYFFNEVIVINDGSTDKTDSVLKEIKDLYNFKYISLQVNKGKGFAMATGVENSTGDIIVFVDADLSNLKEKHFAQLITPVFNNKADMVLGQPTKTIIPFKLNPFKVLTGERALRRLDILPIMDKMKESRFGVETLINLYYKSKKKKVVLVYLKGLKHPLKYQKTTFLKATKQFLSEAKEIIYTLLINYEMLKHFFKI